MEFIENFNKKMSRIIIAAPYYHVKEGLGIVSPPHFVYGFSRTMFSVLHSIN